MILTVLSVLHGGFHMLTSSKLSCLYRPIAFAILVFAGIASVCADSAAQTNGAQYPLRQYLNIRGAGFPTLSPDASQVAFRTSITGTSQVWKVSANSGWPDQLTFFPSSVNSTRWSPRGDRILV